jgi:hypothetical protein
MPEEIPIAKPAGGAQRSAPAGRREKTGVSHPDFFKAWRGVWLFTWKSQLTWRRLPTGLLSLLALPVLVYITTFSAAKWSSHFGWVGNPVKSADDLFTRSRGARSQVLGPVADDLVRIFAEEYGRAEKEWRANTSNETGASRQSKHIRSAHDRIRDRARAVLDDRQFSAFSDWERQRLQRTLMQVREPPWGRLEPFYHWLIDFYFFMILPLGCVRGCGSLIRDELQADTLGFLLTRPLTRARLVVVKYLSQTAWLQIILLVETLLVFGAGQLREIPGLGTLLPLFLAAQFLAVMAWGALGMFLGQVTKRYMPMAIVYGLIVEMGIGRIPTNINTLSLMRHLKSLLAYNPALKDVYEWTTVGTAQPIGALLLAVGIFLSLAALLFTYREYLHTAEMQS